MDRSSGRTTKAGASGWPLALALGVMLVACSSGGEESISSTTPCTDMDFAASISTPSGGDVFFREVSSIYTTCSNIEIQVIVNDLTDIYTVGFDLSYPDSLVSYDSVTLGPLLKQGSPTNPPIPVVHESSGALQVSATRLGADPGVDAIGQQVLLTLKFNRLSVGADTIDFNLSGGFSDVIQGAPPGNSIRPANFGPGHGGLLTVPL